MFSFLLLATIEKEATPMIFRSLAAIAIKAKKAYQRRTERARKHNDYNWELRVNELAEALYQCGIPLRIAKRNAIAFMVICPDFDLSDPKHSKLKRLLEWHQDEFLNAYFDIGERQGRQAADDWMKWIRDNEIFFARIVAIDDSASRYLFA